MTVLLTESYDPEPVDPLRQLDNGSYRDELVVVSRQRLERAAAAPRAVRTPHFVLDWAGGRLQLSHQLPRHRIDNDLAGLLSDELFGPGWATGTETFERLLTGIVLTSGGSALECWALFYRNTMRRLEFMRATSHPASHRHSSLAAYAPVYEHAMSLAGFGSVLELGSCFGFLSLLLAERGLQVTASDLTPGTMRLLTALAPVLGTQLRTLVCDAARVPCPDASFDVVSLVHLLEHLDPRHGEAVLAEATRLARHRVVVAVPYEDVPDAAFGHVRTLTAEDLTALGRRAGWTAQTHNHHGGWLVLTRNS